jgi:hypothetical protein
MNHNEFSIGLGFWCDGRRWRCTDVGTRVVVAISLEPHEVVQVTLDPKDRTKKSIARELTSDPSWLNGPPYAVDEHVFDESDIEGCSLRFEESTT